MKCTATEEVMIERRIERLRQVEQFMKHPGIPDSQRRWLSLFACHNLMTGWFQNSHWRLAWFCFVKAIENSKMEITVSIRLRWYQLRGLSEEQIDDRLLRNAARGKL